MVLAGSLLLAASALTACDERTLVEADCVNIQKRLEAAWERDAVAAQRKATTDVFLKFVRAEKGRVGADWLRKCAPLVGQDVSPEELACLAAVDTIDDVYECGL